MISTFKIFAIVISLTTGSIQELRSIDSYPDKETCEFKMSIVLPELKANLEFILKEKVEVQGICQVDGVPS